MTPIPSGTTYPGLDVYPGGGSTPTPPPSVPGSSPSGAVSISFQDAIREAHKIAVQAEVVDATGIRTPLELIDGSVSLDATAATRATCELLIDPENLPTDSGSPMAPYGNEIALSRGVEFSNGTRELVPLGIFRIDSAEVEDTGNDFSLRVPGFDRSVKIIEAVFEQPYEQVAGVLIPQAIQALIVEVYPECEFNFVSTSLAVPALTAQEGDDRWDFCQGLAEAVGCSLYFDRDGICTLAPVPLGTASAVTQIAEGEVLLSASRTWTRADAVNRVVVTSQNAGTSVYRGVAVDDNDASPTRYGGPFGRATMVWSPSGPAESAITSNEQAAHVAQVALSKNLGISQQVSFSALVNPALDPFDVVRIRRARAGVDEDHIIDSLTIPLSPEGTMDGTTRTTQVVSS